MRSGSGSPTAAAAADGTDGTAAATAAGSGRPRLTAGSVRFKDPILNDRSDDLTALDRGTGERQEAGRLRAAPRSLSSVPLVAATQIPDICPAAATCAGRGLANAPVT
jgi:hypothetical protein